jgi:FixJ family two-component response regulator
MAVDALHFIFPYPFRAKSITAATVFIVDDDPSIRSSLTLLMETTNLKSTCFPNADNF